MHNILYIYGWVFEQQTGVGIGYLSGLDDVVLRHSVFVAVGLDIYPELVLVVEDLKDVDFDGLLG